VGGGGGAILSANYILNKIPHKKKEETPYKLWMEENHNTNTWGA
jgi:hypothetical protein